MIGSLVSIPDQPGTSAQYTTVVSAPPSDGAPQYLTVELPATSIADLDTQTAAPTVVKSAVPQGATVLKALPKTAGARIIKVISNSGTSKVLKTFTTAQGQQFVLADAALSVLNVAGQSGATEADLSVGLNIEAQSETSDVTGIT